MPHLHRIPFNFHGHGHALSGEFRHPLRAIIPAQASASLSTIGGIAVAHGENFHFQDFVCFKSAHTHISGKRRRGETETFVTHASTVVKGLDILGMVKAERRGFFRSVSSASSTSPRSFSEPCLRIRERIGRTAVRGKVFPRVAIKLIAYSDRNASTGSSLAAFDAG